MDPFIRDYRNDSINTYEMYDKQQFDRKFISQKQDEPFTLFHSNIRSIQKNLDQFQVYISQFSHYFSCMVLTETWKVTEKKYI